MCRCSKSTASMGRLAPRFHFNKATTDTDLANKQVKRLERKSEKVLPVLGQPRSLSLSLLPETASLSPTAAKTVKHHTASMMFTFSPGLQHRQPQNVTNSADGEEREKPKGRNDGEDVARICYTSDDARPLATAFSVAPS